MRKFLLLAVCLFALLFVPAAAYGDVGGPFILERDCAVTNPDGAPYYYWAEDGYVSASDVIPYGTILSVTGDFYVPDFMNSSSGRIGRAIYGDRYIYIDLENFAVVDRTDPLEDAYPLTESVMKKVIATDGVSMYAGPSPVFEETAVVPYGTVITFTYGDSGPSLEDGSFAYGEGGGYKGWVLVYDLGGSPTLASRVGADSFYAGVVAIAGDDVCLVDVNQPDEGENGYAAISDPLPAGLILSFEYYYDDWEGTYALVNYLGRDGFLPLEKTGWNSDGEYTDVCTGVLVYNRDQYIVLHSDSILYETAGDRASALETTVPSGSVLGVEATYLENSFDGTSCNCWSLVSYRGREGYILREKLNAYNLEMFSDTLYDTKCTSDFTVYEQPDLNSAVVAECQTADDIYALYSVMTDDGSMSFDFVVGPDFTGWVCDGIWVDRRDPAGSGAAALLASVLGVEPMEAELPPEADAGAAGATEETTADAADAAGSVTAADSAEDPMTESLQHSRDVIILCACVAVMAASAAAAVILLLKRKKKA